MGFRLFISTVVSIVLYLVLNGIFGDHGLLAYSDLLDYRDRLETNISSMEQTREELSATADELRSSAEAVRLEARELGYYRSGERPVRIEGFSPWEPGIEAGTLLRAPEPPPDRQPLFRVAAITAGLVTFFLLLL